MQWPPVVARVAACHACTDFFGLFVFTLSGLSPVSLGVPGVPDVRVGPRVQALE